MIDGLADDCGVWHCLICGPCLHLLQEDDTCWVLHKDIPHPIGTYNDEDNPQ